MKYALTALALLAVTGCSAGAPTPTVTVTESAGTPKSCLEALDLAEEGFQFAADAMYAASDAFTAINSLDLDALDQAAADMGAANGDIESISEEYRAASADCRSGR